MPDVFISVAAFVFAIGVLVAVHEWGHFWVARRLGVKVLRYSIGFGRRLWGWREARTGTEYWVSALPLGGYVKMLDEREGPVDPAELHLAFNRQVPWKRMLIVAAGPALNFVFAIAAYWLIFMIGIAGLKPILAEVPTDSVAWRAGLRGGETVTAVGGEETVTWNDLRTQLLKAALKGGPAELRIQDAKHRGHDRVVLEFEGTSADPEKLFATLGMQPFQPRLRPLIGLIEKGGEAERAGLQKGDLVLAADDRPVSEWPELVKWVQARPGTSVRLKIRRGAEEKTVTVSVASVPDKTGRVIGRIGAGVDAQDELWQDLRAVRRYGPVEALPAATAQIWDLSVLTLKLMGRMIVGDVSWHNVSGPIQIAQYAGYTASVGVVPFLAFLAVVSVSLAVLNLLPVPVLDGGHLLYYGIEMIRRRPLSERVQLLGQKVGMTLLFALMCLAFYNDITRLLTG